VCLDVKLHLGLWLEILQFRVFLSVFLSLEQVSLVPRKEIPEECLLEHLLRDLDIAYIYVCVDSRSRTDTRILVRKFGFLIGCTRTKMLCRKALKVL